MSRSSNPASVLTPQETQKELWGIQLAKARHARSMAKSVRLLRECVNATRASTRNLYQRDQQAARIKDLDEQIVYWNSIAEKAEKAAAQGGGE
ncbi:hypothetical protein [Xanthomonas arboricola]|uniref:hypothetical protein n=1 Tax=Xanthomonas arboricola TaxID=56448 RepID=UPI000C85B168|nr:hypothetical protein [Xanthomonas arboricola]PPU28685.1 hypothetical protein XarCFBP6762_05395 [Xanthomonas arboricola]SOT99593.1 hypothetical protein CFBP6762_02242 [Xanthomonas arboricola pv. fragariae]